MNSNLQNKLSQFEATPPGGVWNKIVDVLDAEQTFSKRLYDYQETPKTSVWKMIEASLEEARPAKIVPFTSRYRRPIRYIAAAGLIAVIFVSATILIKKTDAGTIETASAKSIPAKKIDVQNPATISVIDSNSHIQTIASVQNNSQENTYQPGTRKKRTLSFISSQNIVSDVVLKGRFLPESVDEKELFNFSALNDHMVYSDGDGNAMKLPKKLFSLVSCPDGDGSCKERIQQLQHKLSSIAMTADFTGILDMLRQLQ